jgi:hypothetical protein
MHLLIHRQIWTSNSTISKCLIDGVFEAFILEDVDRGLDSSMPVEEIMQKKVKGKTCIPTGTYTVKITMSNRFKQMMPLLLNVPGYAGIRMHPGNTDLDTEGCLLPGESRAIDKVLNSRKAYAKIFAKMEAAEERGEEITITIKN